jgi:hypothetical protein
VELASRVALICGRGPGRDFFACEVSESAAILFNSKVWLAFLGGLRRARVGSATGGDFLLYEPGVEEALIEKCFPKNIARW